jgi:hypothetical protein
MQEEIGRGLAVRDVVAAEDSSSEPAPALSKITSSRAGCATASAGRR